MTKNAPSHLGGPNSNLDFQKLTGALALSDDFFSTGFLSSQRSESTNNVLGDVANKNTSLGEFVKSFKEIIKGWRSFKDEEDFCCKQSRPPLAIRDSGILNHAANVYTHKLFKLFDEFKNAIGKFWFELSSDGGVYEFEVGGIEGSKIRRSQGNVKAREIVQDGLKKIDKDIENELAKLSISLDGQEMENEVDDGQDVEETLDVNPILNRHRTKTKGVSNARFK
ncbi:unnamed protein product [Dovyalis caffra]|uniref:Protein FAR1-RELATED SEQUENCE n=1 Tax=Dovyalis caffra TaxID=77055 RepID=A0AAV1SFT8_9ROSI|nr:unnamed protein product [Dovyalis caffra]